MNKDITKIAYLMFVSDRFQYSIFSMIFLFKTRLLVNIIWWQKLKMNIFCVLWKPEPRHIWDRCGYCSLMILVRWSFFGKCGHCSEYVRRCNCMLQVATASARLHWRTTLPISVSFLHFWLTQFQLIHCDNHKHLFWLVLDIGHSWLLKRITKISRVVESWRL